MFTLKFQSDDYEQRTVVCGRKYTINPHWKTEENGEEGSCRVNGVTITVYDKLDDSQGVDFTVLGMNGGACIVGFGVAYIENQNGKTIDKIGPYRNN